jgi:uncharacterized RDD family membrane protein YckC
MVSIALAPTCRYCATLVASDALFCQSCGSNLSLTSDQLAGPLPRLGAYVVDYVVGVVPAAFFFALGIASGMDPPSTAFAIVVLPLSLLLGLLFWPGYYIAGYALGTTAGCLIFRLRITTERGERPGLTRGFARWAVSMLGQYLWYVGYFWAIWDPKQQTWHDKAAGTVVVKR